MENKELFCYVNLFSLEQKVYLNEKNYVFVKTSELGKTIPTYCDQEDISRVHLYGDDTYLESLAKEIMNNTINYSKNKNISVEVN